MFKFMVYLKSKKEREKLQMQMTKQEVLNKIRECEETIANLKTIANTLKDDLNSLSYKDLMRIFFENDKFMRVRTREQEDLHKDWKDAYAKFKNLRNKRDEKVKEVIQDCVVRLIKNNPNSDLYALRLDCVTDSVFADIMRIYENLTPFDCEEKQFQDRKCRNNNHWNNLTSWGNRVNLLVHKYGYGMIGGNRYRIQGDNVVVLCK